MKYRLELTGNTFEFDVQETNGRYVLRGVDGERFPIHFTTRADGSRLAVTPWGEVVLHAARRGAEVWADVAGRRLSARVERVRPSAGGSESSATRGAVRAPMSGKLLRLSVAVGDVVEALQPLAVIEAMKMENELLSPMAGVVAEVGASAPSAVDKGSLIVRLEPR